MGVSVFEIVGPIMVGPSSSHTAGMARIGMMANRIINEEPISIHLELSPKMKGTYSGHKSDAALFGGTIGMSEDDARIRDAIAIANEQGITTSVDMFPDERYPQNSARITVTNAAGQKMSITGTSVGGGSIIISEINCAKIEVTADAYHIVVLAKVDVDYKLKSSINRYQVTKDDEGQIIKVFTFLDMPEESDIEEIENDVNTVKISLVKPVLEYGVTKDNDCAYGSVEDACKEAQRQGVSLAEIAIQYEMKRSGFSREAVVDRMYLHLDVMKKSVERGKGENQMLYNLTGGKDARKMWNLLSGDKSISKGIIPKAVAMAIGVMEYNGAMGCLVAAPTAGSSGIMPACIVSAQEEYAISDEKAVNAMFVAALMGVIMAEREVSFSGSVGGCQGEVGVSSAISAAALTSMFTDDNDAVAQAMAMCLKNLLGLVCDPIAGPIEVPCIKRNAIGVANAYTSADMALAGIQSYIPPDEVIDALVDVERRMPTELRCGICGSLACTRTAQELRKKLGQ